MNAGANGGETFQYLTEVTYINEKGKVEVFLKENSNGATGCLLFKIKKEQSLLHDSI